MNCCHNELGKQTEGEMVKKINGCDSCQEKEKYPCNDASFYLFIPLNQKNVQKKYIIFFDKIDLSQDVSVAFTRTNNVCPSLSVWN